MWWGGGWKRWWRGNDRHRADVINYHRGAPGRQGLVSPLLSSSRTSFHVSKPSPGIWTEYQSRLLQLAVTCIWKRGRRTPPPSPPPPLSDDLEPHWQDVTRYLSSLSNWKIRDANINPVSTLFCLGTKDGGGRGEGGRGGSGTGTQSQLYFS